MGGTEENKLRINSSTVDVIRIFAAWCVLLGHCFGFFHMTIFQDEKYFFYIQNMAVIIFFTLAGFLMVYSLERRSEKITWSGYIFHQGKRIYKIYLPALLIVLLIDGFNIFLHPDNCNFNTNLNFKTFLENLFMLQGLKIVEKIPCLGSDRPLWTMAIEWWFYVIFSFFYLKICKPKRKKCKNILIAGGLLLLFLKFLYSGLAVSFVLGMIACIVYAKQGHISIIYYRILASVVGIIIVILGIRFKQAYIIPFFLLIPILFWLLLEATRPQENKEKQIRFLRIYARSTFPLYLLHYPMIEFIINSMRMPKNVQFICAIIIPNIVAIFLTVLLDKNAITGKMNNHVVLERTNF